MRKYSSSRYSSTYGGYGRDLIVETWERHQLWGIKYHCLRTVILQLTESASLPDYFAHTVAGSSVWLFAALACEQNLEFCHFDIEQAFVQSNLEEEECMRLPKGCGRLSRKVVRLDRSLYGLNQARENGMRTSVGVR